MADDDGLAPASEARPFTEAENILLRFIKPNPNLPPHLQDISAKIYSAAVDIAGRSPGPSAELTAGLRKLLEAKDCLVRAYL